MFLSVPFIGSLSISFATLKMALDQPVLPGKLILWTLLMLSLVTWAVLVSKFMSYQRFRKSDILFTKRLRRSRATLEVFEEGWEDPNSLHHEIYLTGAKEAAFQLLGSREADPAIHNRIKKAGKLSRRQIESLRRAFQRGLYVASSRLDIGLSVLRISAIAAPLIGLIGMVWMMMRGFDVAKTFEEVSPWISGSLSYLVFALYVTTPSLIGLLIFRAIGKDRNQELKDFTTEITRLFERSFAAQDSTTVPHPDMEEHDSEAISDDSGKKEFHSIRKAMETSSGTQSSSDPDMKTFQRPQNEVQINPIARQASSAQSAQLSYTPTFE